MDKHSFVVDMAKDPMTLAYAWMCVLALCWLQYTAPEELR